MIGCIDLDEMLKILGCIDCKKPLSLTEENVLYCRNCNRSYSFKEQIITFLKDDKRVQKTALDWDKDAKNDHIRSATATSKEDATGPFHKLPVIPLFDDLSNRAYLDLGCGYGRTLIPCVKGGARVTVGIDISQTMLQKCREYCNQNRLNCLLVNSDISDMPFQDDCFDVTYSAAVMLHLDKDIANSTVKEVRRILKVGGKAFFQSSFPNKCALWTVVQSPEYFTTEPVRHKLKLSQSEARVRRYTYHEISNLFHDFSRTEITPVNYRLFPENIGPFRLPFRDKIKYLNQRFSRKMQQRNSKFAARLLAGHFDVVAYR